MISLHAWSSFSSTPVTALLAYEYLLHGLRAIPGHEPERLMHDDSRGCLSCADKTQIDHKRRQGAICRDCVTALTQGAVPESLVLRLAEAVREVAQEPK